MSDETPKDEILREAVSTEDFSLSVGNVIKNKIGVMVAIPNMGSMISTPLALWLNHLQYKNMDPKCGFFFKIYVPNDLQPIEWARNQCVIEFMRDTFYKRLWFIDADMIPPANAMDLLDFDENLVSGMAFIWTSETVNDEGFYAPPHMKANAFTYNPGKDNFTSIVPKGGKPFYCDAAGASAMLIKRTVLEEMPEPWFRYPRDPYGRGLRGEDLDFCKRLNERGVKVMYVPAVLFGHIKTLELKQVVNYGISTTRDLIAKIKTLEPEAIKASLPDIVFPGEKPRLVPKLEAIEGGRA